MEISKCGFDTVLYILFKVSVSVFLCGKVKFSYQRYFDLGKFNNVTLDLIVTLLIYV